MSLQTPKRALRKEASNIKFIAADMDGTLLNSSGILDPEFFNIYQKLTQQKIMFAAASGRQYYSLMKTFEPINNNMMFIAENGALVMYQGQELYSCTMDKASIVNIIKSARNIPDAHIVLCGKKSAYIETQLTSVLEEIEKYYYRCEYVDDLLLVDDEFIKVAICHFAGSQEHIHPFINPLFSDTHKVVVSAKIWLDIMNINASKGEAIQHLQETLNFTKEQTMSFGDYFNDIEMLQVSAHSYAMENAHKEVKKHARYSAPSNNNSGVIEVIKNLLF